MAFLCALSFLTYYDRVCIMRAQEDIKRDLSLNLDQVGWVFGAFFFAYAVFEMPSGWLGDRFGARVTLTRIVFAWSCFTVLTGAATGFFMLLATRFLFGVGEAGAYPNIARVQSRWLPQADRAWCGGLLWLMARWGGAFSPLLFGMVLRLFETSPVRRCLSSIPALEDIPAWRLAFGVAGLIGGLWCLLFYSWFRDEPSEKRGVNSAELQLIRADAAPAQIVSHSARGVWTAILRCRSLWALAFYYVCGSSGWSFFISWLPQYLNDVHQIDFQGSELASGLPLFCGGISCLVGGILSDWLLRTTSRKYFSRAVLPVCGVLVAASTMLLVPVARSATLAVLLMCVAAAAFDFGQASTWATIVDVGGKHAGAATGFVNMIGNLGSACAPYIGAKILERLGWPVLFGFYATAFALAGLMWLFIEPRRAFYEPRFDQSPTEN